MAILGQKGSAIGIPNISFMASTTWTPACTYEAYVYVIGAGGSGGVASREVDYSATGGGAGGCVVSQLTLVSGTEYTITVGSGGAGIRGVSTQSAGTAGGASAFSGSAITTMSAGGGAAGAIHSSGGGAGGAGGSASGSNIGCNFVGGAGGTTSATKKCSGGGGVGLWTTGRTPTEEASYSRGSALGGNLSNYTRSGISAWGLNLNINDEAMPVAVSPFPDIFTWRDDKVFAYVSSSDYYNAPHTFNAGLQHFGNTDEAEAVTASDSRAAPTASPFIGGPGCHMYETFQMFGSQGCLGSGAGGLYSGAGGATCYGGDGGDGGILIFGTSMG